MHVLVIMPRWLGDSILATAVINALITKHPGCRLTIAGRGQIACLFEGLTACDRFIKVDQPGWGRLRTWGHLWLQTLFTSWDVVIDLKGSALAYALWTKKRYIWRGVNNRTTLVLHQMFELIHADPRTMPHCWINPSVAEVVAKDMVGRGEVLALAPFANSAHKEWPLAHFIAVAQDWLKTPRRQVMVIGSAGDRMRCAPFFAAIPNDAVVDCVGKVSLALTYSYLKHCKAFVGNDSGPMHLAACAGVPILALFDPAVVPMYHPQGERVEVLCKRGEGSTMDTIMVAEVIVALEQLLATKEGT